MKKLIAKKLVLLAAVLLAGVGSASAFEVDGLKYEVIDANARTVKLIWPGLEANSYSTVDAYQMTNIEVPSTVEYRNLEFTVIGIGSMAFYGTTAKSVKLPSSITFVEGSAFYYALELKSIVIPSSVKQFGDGVFNYCKSLTSVDFQNEMSEIPSSTFKECTSLTSFTLSDNIIGVGERAFENCTGLTSMVFPEKVTYVHDYAFSGCSNLSSIKFLTTGDLYISANAFSLCDKLETIISFARAGVYAESSAFSGDVKMFAQLYVPESLVNKYKSNWGFMNVSMMDINSVGGHVIDIPGGYDYFQTGENYAGSNEVQGNITFNGKIVDPVYGYAFVIAPGTNVEIGFSPNSNWGWKLTSATINGTDVTSSLVDGKYTINNISGNQLVRATWLQEEQGSQGSQETTEQCATPTITYADGQLQFECETEGAECHYKITSSDISEGIGNLVPLSATYHISVYATKSGYLDSDTATYQVEWTKQAGIRGDTNGDGVVDVEDVVETVNIILEQ